MAVVARFTRTPRRIVPGTSDRALALIATGQPPIYEQTRTDAMTRYYTGGRTVG